MTLQKGGRALEVKLRIVQEDFGSGELLTPEWSGNCSVLELSCHVRFDSTRRLCGDCSGYDDCGEEPGLLWQKSRFSHYTRPPSLETQLVAISMAPPTPKTLSRQRTAALYCSNAVVIYTHHLQLVS